MAFDAAEYRKRVLTPFKNQRLPQLQAGLRDLTTNPQATLPASLDLVELYDMPAIVSDAVVAAQINAVSDTFNKSLTNASLKKIGPTLVQLHQLLTARNQDFATASFWQARTVERLERDKEKLAEFVQLVADEARVLGLMTTVQLTKFADDFGLSGHVAPEDITAAVQAAGLTVVPPVTPPPVAVPAAVLSEMRKTSCASLVDAIFLDDPPASFSVVDGFVGAGGARLSLAKVKHSRDISEKRPSSDDQNDAVRKTLGALDRLKDDRELEQVVQAWFIEMGRQAAQVEPLLALALKRLTDTRLVRQDAARILTLFAGGQSKAGFPEVQQKIADGSLKEARRLFDALCAAAGESVTDVRTEAQSALEATERRVTDLRNKAQSAVENGDLAVATKALTEAANLCADDDSLSDMLSALPPSAPLNLAVTTGPDGRTVQVMWEPGFGTTSGVRYSVVCKAGQAPKNAHDGTVIAQDVAGTRFDHASAELATTLFYGVAATRGTGFSPVACQQITVVPPVGDVRVESEPHSVTLSWNPPAGARGVRVVQTAPDGRQSELAPNAHGSVTSTGLQMGATYTYLLTALYATAAGDVAAPARRVVGTPRGQVKPVAFVTLDQRAGASGDSELEATWQPVPGFEVEIWHTVGKPRWSYGSRVPMTEIASEATRLTGATAGGSRRDGVRGVAAPGLRHYFAVTRDGDDAIVGQSNELGICPRIADVTAERFQDMLLLSWEWPGEVFDVQVTWDGRQSGSRRMTRPQYIAEGGLRIATGLDGSRVRLRTVPASGEESWASADTVVEIARAAPSVRYTTSWHKRIARPPKAVTLTFSSEESPSSVPVVVTAQPGRVMPYDRNSGVMLVEKTLDLSTTGSATLTIELRDLGPHFWVRAFPQHPGDLRLIDPPSHDLRGA